LPDERETRSQNQLREFLKTNLESRQQLDPVIGVPDRATTENYLSMLRNYLATHEMAASFAILRLDRHDRSVARYGAEACQILLKHVANCCRSTFRTEDMIGVLSDHTLGLVLFDISRESARLVLNRLRWNIRNHRLTFGGKDDFSITVSIAFDMINEAEDEDILLRCENGIERLDKDERNSLTELGG
jgi:diguanylate cyclase (GGDEF)-like protein